MFLIKGKLLDDVLLSRIRMSFAHVESDPIGGKRIYFENAGGSLTLKKVVQVVTKQTALPDNAGRRNDVESIVKEARKVKPDLYVLVDGAQHLPHCSVDVQKLGCDVYLGSSYSRRNDHWIQDGGDDGRFVHLSKNSTCISQWVFPISPKGRF